MFSIIRCIALTSTGFLVLAPLANASESLEGARALSRAFRQAARLATPSVVTIVAYGQPTEQSPGLGGPSDPLDPLPRRRRGGPGQSLQATGLGSGVILSSDGTILTNHHVVQGAEKVLIRLQDGRELVATRIDGDPGNDLATLRVDPGEVELQAIELGDSDALEIGDWVLAIGSPFRLEATVSAGIISAKGRKIDRIERGSLLQTDASINPGNSGGALIDLDGKLVGINTAIATRSGTYQGIGFAIPIQQARWIAGELLEHGRVRRAALGVRLVELNAGIAAKVNLPVGLGVLIYEVIRDSAADRAGMKPLDVVLEFASNRVRNPVELQNIVERLPIGSTQTVKLYRQGEELELQVVLAPQDDPTMVSASEKTSEDEPTEAIPSHDPEASATP